ncbi:MAG TPA: cupin domain-containing protein [Candidatus Dormibacteraeota bacterium]|nr:cupin domain-containing protein [Candidatus Dormibacteraeota bacterium]
MIKPYVNDLKDAAKDNDFFRKVVFTGSHLQLVLMSLEPGEEIGEEVHEVDQLLSIVKGEGKAVLDGQEQKFEKGMAVCVPAGVRHNVINSGDKPMKVFTIYAPPQHAAGTVQEKKPEPVAAGR